MAEAAELLKPQRVRPESGGVRPNRIRLGLFGLGLLGLDRLTVIVSVAGAAPSALATTSIVLAPR